MFHVKHSLGLPTSYSVIDEQICEEAVGALLVPSASFHHHPSLSVGT